MSGGVRGRVDVASGQKRLHLGCGTKDGSVVTVIERLDAVGITGEQQCLFALIPKSKSIHSA